MTKFYIFKLSIPECREDEFIRLMEKHNFLYAKTDKCFITNLLNWLDPKQEKF